MRDLLTVLAGLVILVLVAALAVPPFVDWRTQRDYVDAALSRASGLAVTTDGAIDIRFLPTPRLNLERLRIGAASPDQPALDAQAVETEISLTALLSGEIRFLESRVGRIEIKLPTGTGGDWRVPRTLVSKEALGRAWIFEDLAVAQFVLTTFDPRTGRTDQGFAEGVRLQSQALAGPWRAEGRVNATRFTLLTGEIEPSGPTFVKLSTEGEGQPRLSLDARMLLEPGIGDVFVPRFEGTLRLAAGRDVVPVPYVASAGFKTDGRTATLENLALDAGEGGSAFRLTGTGQLTLDEPRLSVSLEGRRVDLDAVMAAFREATDERLRSWRPRPGLPVELALKLDGIALAGEELAGLTASASLVEDRIGIDRIEFTAPGQTRVTGSGEVSLSPGGGANGRLAISTRSADRLAAYLGRLGIADISADALTGRSFEASGDVVAAHPIASFRNLQVRLGDATLTGAVRYTAAEASTRARVDAQLAIQGLDLDALPQLTGVFDATRTLDLGLILDARNVGYGTGERAGRIAARFSSEGPGLTIDLLEIADLAGANASLRGRITPDGAGRIGGRLRARRAAPLIDLVGRASLGGLAELIPTFLREAPLDVAVSAARPASAAATASALITKISGSAGAGGLEAEITSSDGRVREVAATLSTEEAGSWLGGPTLGRPARLELKGERDRSGRLGLGLTADIAGLRIATTQPFGLSERDDAVETGAATLSAADIAPLMAAIGQSSAVPVDAEIKARVGRREGAPRVELNGHVGETVVEADLSGRSARDLSGRVLLGRVSLPWIASTLALGSPKQTPAGAVWSSERFPAPPNLPFAGTISVRALSVDLGRDIAAERAEFTLATTADGFVIRDFAASALGGRIGGTVTINRQGGLAAVIGEATATGISLPDLLGRPLAEGRISGNLRFGGSGESAAGIVSNLGGAGAVELENLQVAAADPTAIERIIQRAMRSEDTLAPARLQALANEELDRAPARVAKATGQVIFVSGGFRISPLLADAGSATWQGTASVDFRTMSLDFRGSLTAKTQPRNWGGAPPYLTLGWAGPIGRPARNVDVRPLANGLASVVLTRELDRIETFELDAAERMRLNSRVEMDRARRAAAEEAARAARLREQAERTRLEAERARLEAEQILGVGRGPDGAPRPPAAPPVDIRPPAQGGAAAGGG